VITLRGSSPTPDSRPSRSIAQRRVSSRRQGLNLTHLRQVRPITTVELPKMMSRRADKPSSGAAKDREYSRCCSDRIHLRYGHRKCLALFESQPSPVSNPEATMMFETKRIRLTFAMLLSTLGLFPKEADG
jgi:hypothetical protein